MEKLKGLKWYLIVLLAGFSFFIYSQLVGWRWLGATKTERPDDEQKNQNGYRYFRHK